MKKQLFKLPNPTSSRVREEFQRLVGRACKLSIYYDDQSAIVDSITFDGVEAFKVEFECAITSDCYLEAHGRLIDVGASPWLIQICRSLESFQVDTAELKHLMIYLDDGPSYEIVCRSFSLDCIANATNGQNRI